MSQLKNSLISNISFDEILGKVYNFLPDLIISIIIVFVFILFWKLINKILLRLFSDLKINKTVQNFTLNIAKNAIAVVAILTVLSQIGINTTSILASIGVVGLTIGFAARDALSNIISGLFIFWDRPFVIDDLIEINGQYGKVQKITMRSTRVSTVDGKMLTIPNTEIINSTVASYTNFPNLRIKVNFTVAVNEDLAKIRKLLFDLVKNRHEFLEQPEPELVLNSINDYNIELKFRIWIRDEKEHIKIRYRLREEILDILLKANIEMPYETINILVDNSNMLPN